MADTVLIRLCFDPYSAWAQTDSEAVVVTDLPSYAAAREAIEVLKAGARSAPLIIVVRSRHFFAGFHDLSLLGDRVKVDHIAPVDRIAAALNLPSLGNLTNQDLIAVGVRDIQDLAMVSGANGLRDLVSIEDALLVKAFGAAVFGHADSQDFGSWFRELIAFLYSEEAVTCLGWRVEALRDLAEERVGVALETFSRSNLFPFVQDLMSKSSRGKARVYLNQLTVRFWLQNYSRLARRTVVDNIPDQVGRWEEVQGEAWIWEAVTSWCTERYSQGDDVLHQRLEEVLALLLEQGDLIEEEDLGRFIRQTSGRFAAEYDAAQVRFGELLMIAVTSGVTKEHRAAFSTYLVQLSTHFAPLFQRTGQPSDQAPWVASLLEFSDVVHHLGEAAPTDWTDWVANYELLIKAKHLAQELQDCLPAPYHAQLADLRARFSTLDERLNSVFADWVLGIYPDLVTSSVEQPLLVMNAARLALDRVAHRGRVILLVLDALDWELWHHLRSVLGQEGFVVQGNEAGLAMLPSITEFSRRALFAGMSPRNLSNFVDDVYGTEIPPQEEAKTLARALGYLGRVGQLKPLPTNQRVRRLENEMVYVNGTDKDFRQALALDAKCYALVYTEIDAHIHVSKLDEFKLKAAARDWLTALVKEIVQGIQQNQTLREETNLQIVVTSDHGFVDVSRQGQAVIDSSLQAFLDLERHGRLAIVRTKGQEVGEGMAMVLQMTKEFCSRHALEWRAIWREQGATYGLAESSPSEGEVVAWLMPQLFRYVRRGKGNYVHGGLSMYEMIVPLAVLQRGEIEIEAPVTTLTGRLSSEEEGTLSIVIMNKNDRPFQGLTIDISELAVAGLHLGDIGPGEVVKLDVQVVAPRSGDLPIHLVLEGEIGGIRRRFEESRVLAIQPGRRERMRLSTRRTFDDE